MTNDTTTKKTSPIGTLFARIGDVIVQIAQEDNPSVSFSRPAPSNGDKPRARP